MRAVQQLRLAAEAEGLRLRRMARRTATRIVLGCIALVLLLAALAVGHVAAWFWLREVMAARFAALVLTGVDLLIAVILGVLAARSAPGRVELEALELRRRALQDAAGALTLSAVMLRVMDAVMRSRGRK